MNNKSKLPIILGIVSIFTWLFPILGVIVSIVGIVLSSKSLKLNKFKVNKIALGLNITGLVLSLTHWIAGTIIIYNKLI